MFSLLRLKLIILMPSNHFHIQEGDEEGLAATQVGSCEQDPDKGTESVTVSVPGIGLKKLTMNTSQMQEIAQAARATYEFANALGSSFAVHAEVSEASFCTF